MIIQREVFIPTVKDIDIKKRVYIFIDRINSKHSVTIDKGRTLVYKTHREVWEFIDKCYTLLSQGNKGTAIIVIDNETRTELLYGLGKATIISKLERIKKKDISLKRIKNVRRRMVVDNKYNSKTKKLDTRIFDRKNYSSSNSRGIG